LQIVGIKVEVAHDGQQALDRLMAAGPDRFDLVLMDLQMPVLDGHAATAAIRQDARFAKLPIVAMSASAINDARQRCLDEGMQDFVTKPVQTKVLFDTLHRWLGHKAVEMMDAIPTPHAQTSANDAKTFDFAQIKEIDSVKGLANMAGKPALYRDMLSRFYQGQATTVEAISQHFQQGSIADAERLTHTLKGLAGSIGAAKVAAAAQQLEEFFATGNLISNNVQPSSPGEPRPT